MPRIHPLEITAILDEEISNILEEVEKADFSAKELMAKLYRRNC